MIDITFLHVYTYIYVNTHIPHMLKCALYLLKESGGIFFGGYGIIILGVIFFRASRKAPRGCDPPTLPNASLLPNRFVPALSKYHILFFYELTRNHFYSAGPVCEISVEVVLKKKKTSGINATLHCGVMRDN